jgi:hypothetical protein
MSIEKHPPRVEELANARRTASGPFASLVALPIS